MTTQTKPTDLAATFAAYEAQAAEYKRQIAEARPANKTALFDALAAAGITRVEVEFDGYGDSGQIQGIGARAGEADSSLPDQLIDFVEPGKEGEQMNRKTINIRDAIEALVYDALEETHPGWEDNEGSCGHFTFDVAAREISLSYNERYVDSHHHDHVF